MKTIRQGYDPLSSIDDQINTLVKSQHMTSLGIKVEDIQKIHIKWIPSHKHPHKLGDLIIDPHLNNDFNQLNDSPS